LNLPGLAIEQGYKGTSSAKLNKIITEVDIEDDLDELLQAVNS
jgi:hypothetical protein